MARPKPILIDRPAMPPAAFCAAGVALYGKEWKAPLARRLGRSWQQINQYATGRAAVPEVVRLALAFLASHPNQK